VTPYAWLRWTWRIAAILVAIVALYVLYVAVHIWWVAREDDHPHSDAIVVLGASQYNGTPSPVFAARLDHALTLYRMGVSSHIVTVGGKEPGDVYTEAESGATYLEKRGVPSSAVVADGTGRDTLESVRAVDAARLAHRSPRHRPVALPSSAHDGEVRRYRRSDLAGTHRSGEWQPWRRTALHRPRDGGLHLLQAVPQRQRALRRGHLMARLIAASDGCV
jgi:hypothetical protein